MIKPKEKRERYLGERLNLKGERCASPKCALVRKPYRPGAHGQSRKRRSVSEFGRQVMEKQKFKLTYGLKEKNLRRLFKAAEKSTGSTTAKLLELMERRLDNVIFRLGFAPSRATARQLVVHGHVFLNGRRVRSPGLGVKAGDVISFRPESNKTRTVSELKDSLKKYEPPSWLGLDKEKLEGRVLSEPQELTPAFEVNLLVESFSR